MDTATLPPRTRKPRGQGASRRGEILHAAKRLFLEQGVDHATMRRIATEVGVSPTTLYVYFPDKAAILMAISEGMFDELLVAHAACMQQQGTPVERFRAGLYAYINLGLARPDEYRLTFSAGQAAKGCAEIEAANQSFAMLEQSVAELMAIGVFSARDPTLVAEAVWAGMHGLVMLLLDHAQHIASDHQALIDMMVEGAIAGFRVQTKSC